MSFPDPLPGRSRAEDEKILLARWGFVRDLLEDPRIPELFTALDRTTEMFAAADRFAPLGTALANRIGLNHRSALFLNPTELGRAIDAVPVTEEFAMLVNQARLAREAAIWAYANLDGPIAAAEIEIFVRKLGVPWRWLALELATQYVALFWSRLYGCCIEQARVLLVEPAMESLQPRPGEDPAAAFLRCGQALANATQRYLTAQRRHKQAGPKSEGGHLERWGAWCCRRRVKGHGHRRIARDAHEEPSNVRRAIAKVEPLLDLPSERFPAVGT